MDIDRWWTIPSPPRNFSLYTFNFFNPFNPFNPMKRLALLLQ